MKRRERLYHEETIPQELQGDKKPGEEEKIEETIGAWREEQRKKVTREGMT